MTKKVGGRLKTGGGVVEIFMGKSVKKDCVGGEGISFLGVCVNLF